MKLRSKIWRTSVPGQEITKTPSREYIEAAQDVQKWIRENHPNQIGMQSAETQTD